ncbi:MAG: hypothetical protein EXS05_23700 [Planctomycetaceae bacterium]|nr:hypothetical protein [Planctomycetaceae bacterium]
MGAGPAAALLVWRFGPSVSLIARGRARVTYRTDTDITQLVLWREGRPYQTSIGGGTLDVAPGLYEVHVEPTPDHSDQFSVDHVSILHQTLFTGHYVPRVAHPIREVNIERGDRITVTASFLKSSSASSASSVAGPFDGGPLKTSWGEFVDPDGDCQVVEIVPDKLAITIPAKFHDLNPTFAHQVNAPRVWQDIQGDFVARVVVLPFKNPESGTATFGEVSFAAAGLLVWGDEKNFLRLMQARMGESSNDGLSTHAEWFHQGEQRGHRSDGVTDTATHLEIERKGSGLILRISADGSRWQEVHRVTDLPLPKTVKVGIAAVNTVNREYRFELQALTIRSARTTVNGAIAKTSVMPPAAVGAPFDASQAEKQQRDWGAHLGVPVEIRNSLGMTLRLIPPGEFRMGCSPEESQAAQREAKLAGYQAAWIDFTEASTQPQHAVRITQPYYLGVHEVTLSHFKKFVEQTGYKTTSEREPGEKKTDPPQPLWRRYGNTSPVMFVTWDDAQQFCRWLSAREGRTYRLPTEAQWEYACRAGTTTRWFCGDDPKTLPEYAWYGKEGPDEGGRRKPNSFGIYDMHGNVAEWCVDWHAVDYYGRSPPDDPVELTQRGATSRVVRGGGFSDLPELTRSAARSYDAPNRIDNTHGFRVAIVGIDPAGERRRARQALPAEAPDETVELLTLIQPDRDVGLKPSAGTWRTENGALLTPEKGLLPDGYTSVQIPVAVPEEYELTVIATRLEGSDGFWVGLVSGEREFVAGLDEKDGQWRGFKRLDGRYASESENVSRRLGAVLKTGVEMKLVYTVRGDAVTVAVDGIEALAWQGDLSRLTLTPMFAMAHRKSLFLMTNASAYRISSVKLRPLAEKDKAAVETTKETSATVPSSLPKPKYEITIESSRLEGHTGPVYCVVASHDGRFSATCGVDETVRVWDLATGRTVQEFKGHKLSDERRRELGVRGAICAAFAPDATRIVSGGWDGVARIWNVETGEEIRQLPGHVAVIMGVDWSPDGQWIATVDGEWNSVGLNRLRLWNAETGQQVHELATDGRSGLTSVAFSADGLQVVSTDADNQVRVWDVKSGRELHRWREQTKARDAAFSPDGRIVAAGFGGARLEQDFIVDPENAAVRLYDLERGGDARRLEGHTGSVSAVAFSRDGRFVASASDGEHLSDRKYHPARDYTIRLWSVEDGTEVVRINCPICVHSIVFSRDGRHVLSCGEESVIRIWSLPDELFAVEKQ